MWIRRTAPAGGTCALRFQVDRGKGVLRVSRPGVLIVPPARNHGHEDHLAPPQLRSSLFLHVPGPGQPRESFSLEGLTDTVLGHLDPDVWFELSVVRGPSNEHNLEYIEDDDVIALGGDVAPAYELPHDRRELAEIGQIVELVTGRSRDQDDLIDDVIEADSETAHSEDGFVFFDRFDQEEREPGPSDSLISLTPGVDRVERTPPPVHDTASMPPHRPHRQAPPPAPPPAQQERLELFPGGPHRLARHLRRQLDRKVITIVDLESRVARLEQRLRQLGEDPEAL